MLTKDDKREIMRMMKSLKDEIRNEMWGRADDDKTGRDALTEAVNDAENAICDVDANMDARMADIENALCELDEEE